MATDRLLVVWKYRLTDESSAVYEILLPGSAALLHIDIQHGAPCLWALVDPELRGEPVRVLIAGTGHEVVPPDAKHINTFVVSGGEFVFHAFDVTGCEEAPE